MKNVRLLCLLVMALVAAAPTVINAGPVCCWEFAAWCYSQCTEHGGIYTLDCPFPSFEICVCNDNYYSPGGGPDCPAIG